MKRVLSTILIIAMMLSVMPVISMADTSDAPYADSTAEMPENLLANPKNASLWYTNPTYVNSVTYQTKNEWTADGYAGYAFKTTGTVTAGSGWQRAAGSRIVAASLVDHEAQVGEHYVIQFAARSLTEGVGFNVRIGMWNGAYSGTPNDLSQILGYEGGAVPVSADGEWNLIRATFPALREGDINGGKIRQIVVGMDLGTPKDVIMELNNHYKAIPDYTPYFAKEAACELGVEADVDSVEPGESISLTATTLNQLGLEGALEQGEVNWYVTNTDRTEKIETAGAFSFDATGNEAVLTIGKDVEPGDYSVVAESMENSNIRKGIDITVLAPTIKDYIAEGDPVPGEAYDIEVELETIASESYTLYSEIDISAALVDDEGSTEGIEQDIRWTMIDKDRRYEVEKGFEVDVDENNVATYRFTEDMAEGTYYIWVYNGDNFEMGRSVMVNIDYTHKDYIPGQPTRDGSYNITLAATEGEREYYTSLNELVLDAKLVDEDGSSDDIEQNIGFRVLMDDKEQPLEEGINIAPGEEGFVVTFDALLDEGTYYIWAYNRNETEMGRLYEVVVDNSQMMLDIVDELNDTDSATLKNNLPKYVPHIDSENTLYEKTDKDNLDSVIKAMVLQGDVFTLENLADNFELACIVSLHSAPNPEVKLVYEDGSLIYEDELGVASLDADGADLYSNIYKKLITDKGREQVITCFAGALTKTDITDAFCEAVVLSAIANTIYSGSGDYLFDILTEANLDAAGITASAYLTASSKAPYAEAIAFKTLTKAELEAELAKLYTGGSDDDEDEDDEDDDDDDRRGSSGGGGGVSIKGPTVAVPAQSTPATQEGTKEEGDISFADLNADHWAFANIQFLAKLGILAGDEKGNMNPEKPVTREEFVKLLVVAFDLTGDNAKGFSDVKSGAWYEGYVNTAVSNGIISGKGDGSFGVGEAVTREDMCVMIARILGMADGAEGSLTYSDADSISDYAKASVGYLSLLSMINGKPDNTFCPKEPCTRAQAARVIADLINYEVMEVNGK